MSGIFKIMLLYNKSLKMNTILILILSLTFSCLAYENEFHIRQALPNFSQKLTDGGEIKIAYLGGSITKQPGWRIHSQKWFREQFPKAKIKEIFAALGGTGSELGVFRYDDDVLRHKPDLVFVEFAVNDGRTSEEIITKAFEGIIHKTWKADPNIDICFVYTLHEKMLPEFENGGYPYAASIMEKIAEHYGIPSIHMGVSIAQKVKKGEILFKGEKTLKSEVAGKAIDKTVDQHSSKPIFAMDACHPYVDSGHMMYTEAIVRGMKEILKKKKTFKHQLPAPIRNDFWLNAKKVAPSAIKPGKGWIKLSEENLVYKHFKPFMEDMWLATEPGTSIEFKFKGTYLSLYDILGPDCGTVEVELNGDKKIYQRIDAYCDYHRLKMLEVNKNLPDQIHHVKITLTDQLPDKRALLHDHRKAFYDKNPEMLKTTNFYLGGIFIIGEIVE